jgi:hypothetical protein
MRPITASVAPRTMILAAPQTPSLFAMLWVKLTKPSFTVDKTDLVDDVCGAESPVCTTSCSIVGVKEPSRRRGRFVSIEQNLAMQLYQRCSVEAVINASWRS